MAKARRGELALALPAGLVRDHQGQVTLDPVGVGADLNELLPVGGVAGQPGAFQAEHDAGPAEGDLGDQLLEPGPVRGRGARSGPWSTSMTWTLSSGPAERNRAAPQVVLPPGRLGVVDHPVEGGLSDVEVGVAARPRLAAGSAPGQDSGPGWCT